MSCIVRIFCCVPRNRHQNKPCHAPPQTQVRYQSPPISQVTVDPTRRSRNGFFVDVDAGVDTENHYNFFVPLPRYTPRPVDVNHDEKLPTFEQVQSWTDRRSSQYPPDEKTPLDLEVNQARANNANDHSSDASSTFSVPSSFGNTSTATTETPPPPYSSNSSWAPSRRSISLSTSPSVASMVQGSDMPLPITQPRPALRRSYDGQGSPRTSVDLQRSRGPQSDLPFPPAYSRP
ncbi:hypothetical protein D8B26_004302 [Coccidioides posadasii str. Silveira]|uniref:Uncharacterized protein n=2 Tax=Coccidioides posadasii TaxID=199306 RepID=E9DCH0_COCPS|nr:conserved hypothetical protein [Coccidioides posadasii str. Silveira]QVM09646.1 hypothetical protein D8B26_004302 [Coccidioides posadasii str. Silveira]